MDTNKQPHHFFVSGPDTWMSDSCMYTALSRYFAATQQEVATVYMVPMPHRGSSYNIDNFKPVVPGVIKAYKCTRAGIVLGVNDWEHENA